MSHYFSNVTVFDGRTVKTKQGVHVAGGTIEWIGPHARAPRIARAASEVEGTGRTVTPGLIDCHVHLSFDGGADFAGEAVGLGVESVRGTGTSSASTPRRSSISAVSIPRK